MNFDLSKLVPSKEDRERYFALWKASEDAGNALDEARDAARDPTLEQRNNELWRKRRELSPVDYMKECDAVDAAMLAETARISALPEIIALTEKQVAANEAYVDDESIPAISGGRCAMSNVPLLDDDETLEDYDTGEFVLRCLILPPRPKDEDEEDEGSSEAVKAA